MTPPHPRPGRLQGWLLLGFGLLIYVGVQSYLTVSPLRHWTLTPEADDTLTYVLKSQQMRECFFQDCPALLDLREQLHGRPGEEVPPEVARQREFAISRVFPVYHPLFSLVLLGISSLGISLMEAYRGLWTLAPWIFGVAFASFLGVLLGPGVAGIALILLAFKVFPDTGLHHLVPSNLTMALALLLWSRIIVCRGWAPFSLLGGTLVLMGMHLVGVIYAGMAAALALAVAEGPTRRRLLWLAGAVAGLILALYLVARLVQKPAWAMPPLFPGGPGALRQFLAGAGRNLLQVMVENVKFQEGLWGSPPIFLGALVLGFAALERERQSLLLKTGTILFSVPVLLIFYVSHHPADLFFRVWIPLVVLLFGVVARALALAVRESQRWWREARDAPPGDPSSSLTRCWPVVLLAVLLGYAGEMMLRGTEQIEAMTRHLRDKEPLAFYPSQPELLLSRARPGDRVLYTSVLVMDYYLIHGALRLGAVYYHPLLAEAPGFAPWLRRPDIRFAAGYHPTVYHPSFEGREESRWWITMPEFRPSPLSRPRVHGPLAREGKIPLELFQSLELRMETADHPLTLAVGVENRQQASLMEVILLDPQGKAMAEPRRILRIPRKWSGRLAVDIGSLPRGGTVRLVFPQPEGLFLTSLSGGEDGLNWPWKEKARLTFYPREAGWPITVSFDPAALLPEPLKNRRITVLDDRGSSVLLELGPQEDR